MPKPVIDRDIELRELASHRPAACGLQPVQEASVLAEEASRIDEPSGRPDQDVQKGTDHSEADSEAAADAKRTGRHAVHSGEMTKAPHGLGKAKTRLFTLWSDGVLSYHAKKERSMLKPLWRRATHEVEIQLDRVSMRRTNDMEVWAREELGFSEFTIVLVVEDAATISGARRAWALDRHLMRS